MPVNRTRELEAPYQRGYAVTGKQKKQAPSAPTASNAKDATPSTSSITASAVPAQTPGLVWSSESAHLLNAYRVRYMLDTPGSFHSTLSSMVLNAPGIGLRSPTMARKKGKRRMTKAQLAAAVRKHFNNTAVNEADVVADFIYAAGAQGRKFRIKFGVT